MFSMKFQFTMFTQIVSWLAITDSFFFGGVLFNINPKQEQPQWNELSVVAVPISLLLFFCFTYQFQKQFHLWAEPFIFVHFTDCRNYLVVIRIKR